MEGDTEEGERKMDRLQDGRRQGGKRIGKRRKLERGKGKWR